MTAIRYLISRTVDRWVSAYRRRRRRKVTERIMNDLPPSLQRDIGWDPTGPTRQR